MANKNIHSWTETKMNEASKHIWSVLNKHIGKQNEQMEEKERKKKKKKKTSNLSPLNYYLWWTSYSPIYIQKQIISHTHAYKLSFSFTFRFLHAKSLYEKHFTKRKIHAHFKYEEKALNLNYYFGSSSLSFTKQQISPKNLF